MLKSETWRISFSNFLWMKCLELWAFIASGLFLLYDRSSWKFSGFFLYLALTLQINVRIVLIFNMIIRICLCVIFLFNNPWEELTNIKLSRKHGTVRSNFIIYSENTWSIYILSNALFVIVAVNVNISHVEFSSVKLTWRYMHLDNLFRVDFGHDNH